MAVFSKKNQDEHVGDLQRKLDDKTARADIVINTIADGVAVIDQSGIIRLFNPAAANISGWKVSDATDLDYRSVFQLYDSNDHKIDNSLSPITAALVTRKAMVRDDVFFKTAGGKSIQVYLTATPTNDADGGIVVTFRDITREKAEEHEQADFISTASHEMRTPLAIIEGYVGMLLNPGTATLDDRARTYAQKAHESAQYLGRLFQNLLDVTKADDGRIPINSTLVDSATVAKRLVSDFSPQAEAKGLTLAYDAGPGMQPVYVIYVDIDLLKQILENILENAIKYTPQGSVTIRLTGNDSRVRFSVTDTGIGIPPEDVPHLFQKFYRVDNSDTREIGGNGLGLYLVRKLAESMGGQIGVDSEYGHSSTFWVEFPRLSRDEVMRKIAEIKAGQGQPNNVSQ